MSASAVGGKEKIWGHKSSPTMQLNCENDIYVTYDTCSDAKQKKNTFFFVKKSLFKKKIFFKASSPPIFFKCFFIIIYNLKTGKYFLILWNAYSCYIQVVKHFIQYVNCIFIDSETNYLMTIQISIAT